MNAYFQPPPAAPLEWEGAGAAVFPCKGGHAPPPAPDGKRTEKTPLTKGGFKDASDDPAQWRAWWKKWPKAWPAMRADGFILDVDCKPGQANGRETLESLNLWEEACAAAEIIVTTPSGGFHLYFRRDGAEHIKNAAKLLPGLDVRTSGRGYVLIPPAPGYVFLKGAPELLARLNPAPAALIDALTPKGFTPDPSETRPLTVLAAPSGAYALRRGENDRADRWTRAAIEGIARDIASTPPGSRNGALNKGAFKLFGLVPHGLISESHATAVLEDAGKACGLTLHEIRQTLRSARKGGLAKPYPLPVFSEPPRPSGAAQDGLTERPAPITPPDDAAPLPPMPESETAKHLARLKGQQLRPVAALPLPPALAPEVAQSALESALDAHLSAAAAWHETPEEERGAAPVTVIKATVGLGKSSGFRKALANRPEIFRQGNVQIYAPSLDLGAEWKAAAQELGLAARVIRGRTADDPERPGFKMCDRAPEAEMLGQLGQSVQDKLCMGALYFDPETGGMKRELCPFFSRCAYQGQKPKKDDPPEIQILSHEHLTLSGFVTEGRRVALRVVDESPMGSLRTEASFNPELLTKPRDLATGRGGDDLPERLAAMEAAMPRLEEAAMIVRPALENGKNPIAALTARGFTSADMDSFAKVEGERIHEPYISPSMTAAEIAAALDAFKGEKEAKEAAKLRRFWLLLGEAFSTGACERIWCEHIPMKRPDGGEEMRASIRMGWMKSPHEGAPVLVLDADANETVSRGVWPDLAFRQIEARLNAVVIQAYDTASPKSRFVSGVSPSDASLNGMKAIERTARRLEDEKRIIQAAVAQFGAGNVLYVNYRDAVRELFVLQDGMSPEDGTMKEAPLWGARVLWFGPGLKGLDGYKGFKCVIIGSRYEIPPYALEAMGRAIFGDSGTPLRFLKPGEQHKALASYSGGAGLGWAVEVNAHPDDRIAALQTMVREQTTLQAIGRLRLVWRDASNPGVIINLSNLPIPELPPDVLMRRDEMEPNRIQAALFEAAERGEPRGVILTAPELAKAAPLAFETEAAAKLFLNRNGGAELGITPIREYTFMGMIPNSGDAPPPALPSELGPAARILLSSLWAPRSGVIAELRRKGERGRYGAQAYIAAAPEDAERMAQELWGALSAFRVLHVIGPAPEPPRPEPSKHERPAPEAPPSWMDDAPWGDAPDQTAWEGALWIEGGEAHGFSQGRPPARGDVPKLALEPVFSVFSRLRARVDGGKLTLPRATTCCNSGAAALKGDERSFLWRCKNHGAPHARALAGDNSGAAPASLDRTAPPFASEAFAAHWRPASPFPPLDQWRPL